MPRMVKPKDPLSQALASGAMANLLRYFAVNPDAAPHGRALQRFTRLHPRSIRNELDRLISLGILRRQEDGRHVRYRLNEEHPVWPHLRQMVRHLSRPADVLPFALAGVGGIEAAFIFGSYAKGAEREDSDVDVFILGDTLDETELARRTLEASVLLGREVNVLLHTRNELRDRLEAGPRFFRDVLGGTKEWILGSSASLGAPESVATRG